MSDNLLLQAAEHFLDAGLSVIPCGANKRPACGSWKGYQEHPPRPAEIERWFGEEQHAAIAVIGGTVSDGLEIIDFDERDLYPEWRELVGNHNPALLESLPAAQTPSGGFHVYFRSNAAEGNQKLARTAEKKVMIETRGEGGYALVPPSPDYRMTHGKLTKIPYLTDEERELLLEAARSFNLYVRDDGENTAHPTPADAGDRPGDAFNSNGGWETCRTLLEQAGWKHIRTRSDGAEEWRRPGKREGLSATYGHIDNRFYVFSTNAVPFDSERTYQPFSVYAILEHGGDFSAASKTLAEMGYGTPAKANANVRAQTSSASTSSGDGHPEAEPELVDEMETWPYQTNGHQIIYLKRDKKGRVDTKTVCDFEASIREEITTEHGEKIYHVQGTTRLGKPFEVEIGAPAFEESRRLKSALGGAAGGRAPIHKRMAYHLPHAVKALSGNMRETLRYERTGWALSGGDNPHFLLPGRAPEGAEISIDGLPYTHTSDGDLGEGLLALEGLLTAHTPEQNTIIASHLLAPPLARRAGLSSERYALLVHGMSGSLKTSFAQAAMCLWGKGFSESGNLIKWGDGATSNALITLASQAHDLPFLIDNYKRSTGRGAKAFIAFVHNVLEGGEKRRLNRASQLKQAKEIRAWPIATGEDVPDTDPASIARMLIVRLTWERGAHNEALQQAQDRAEHLEAVGAEWLAFLESDEGEAVAKKMRELFPERRAHWGKILRQSRTDMVNPLRVASSLAMNELAYQAAQQCPALADTLYQHREAHHTGLMHLAGEMASYGGESREAARYLQALREALGSGRATLLPLHEPPTGNEGDSVVGWDDPAGDVIYLLPSPTRQVIDRLLGDEGLSGISGRALYAQLADLGALKETSSSQTTKAKRLAGAVQRVLWLDRTALLGEEGEDARDDTDDQMLF